MKITGDKDIHYYCAIDPGPVFADTFWTGEVHIEKNVGWIGVVYGKDGRWVAL